MEKNEEIKIQDDDLGLLLKQLEDLENFYPCFKSMINKEE